MKKKHKKYKIPAIHPSIHVIAAFIAFMILMQLSRGSTLFAWEESLFRTINHLPEWLNPFFQVASWLGSIYALALLLIVLAFLKKHTFFIRLLLASILSYEVSGFAKDIWGRARPHELLSDVIIRDYFRGPGFPSGHTALAVTMAFVVGHYLPKKYLWIVPLWIVAVGLSRIYLGVHAPMDILGGFTIGWFSYMLFRHVRLSKIAFGKRISKKTKSK